MSAPVRFPPVKLPPVDLSALTRMTEAFRQIDMRPTVWALERASRRFQYSLDRMNARAEARQIVRDGLHDVRVWIGEEKP